ncbi:MAG: DNA/RNA endonuclease [Bacteroidetes bacterium HGW-Bacteroidetes-21]|nr:MAG: DNA/RNA endonuclease [Bacteroidetes bacterium HGW-Bacteroidetes-21]
MKSLLTSLVLIIPTLSFAQDINLLPTSTTQQIVYHTYFTLSYSEPHEQAEWVAYLLTAQRLSGNIERSNKFRADSSVITGSAHSSDYAKSGYDKGHLAPAADMKYDSIAMKECFLMSNMSPQLPSFNRGIWKELEESVRSWALEKDSLFIVAGGVLKGNLTPIGVNEVAVPKYFYKIILHINHSEPEAIAFLLPNETATQRLSDYAITIDSLETLTDIDFFPVFPNSIENILESKIQIKQWFSEKQEVKETNTPSSGTSVQCSQITKNGTRCKRKTTSPNGKCYQHGGN